MPEPTRPVPTLDYADSHHGAAPGFRAQPWIVVVLLYVGALLVLGPRARLSQWQATPDDLQPAAEAMAWLDGRLDLPSRGGDIAEFQGRYYSHFPPLFTLICYAVFGLHGLIVGNPPVFWGWIYVLLVAAPIPGLVWLAMKRAMASPCAPPGRSLPAAAGASATSLFGWAAVLAAYMLAGTCFWPVLAVLGNKNGGWIYSTQLLMAQSGLAILLIDLFGRRRLWLGGIGLIIAAWSRQPTFLYGIALVWAAWTSPRRGRALVCAGIPLAIALAVPMGLSWAKFGSPLESGYQYVYAGRHDPLAESARDPDGTVHIFGLRYIPYNLYYYHVCPPQIDVDFQGLHITGVGDGTSLWICSPLLLLIFWDARRWWRDPLRRVVMLCALGIMALLMTYHYTGRDSAGYCRYTLDFTLPALAVIAPGTCGRGRQWLTLGCLAWSAFYFYMVR